MKIFLSFSLSLLLFAGFGYQAQAQVASAATVTSAPDTTIAVKVKGVGCANDLQLIVNNVEKLDGVSTCEVVKKGAVTSFKVSYDPNEAVQSDIHAAIEGTGCCHDPEARPYKVKLQ